MTPVPTLAHGPVAGQCDGWQMRIRRSTSVRTTDLNRVCDDGEIEMRKSVLTLLVILTALTATNLLAQAQRGQRGPAPPARPTPRLPDGRVNLGPPAGEKGIWAPTGIVQLYVFPNSVNRASPASPLANAIKAEAVPF